LAFTRYCHCQYCMVCGMHNEGQVGGRILPNSRAIVLQQCGQCRRAGRLKGRLIRAQTAKVKPYLVKAKVVMMICSPPQGTPPSPNSAADMAHSTLSTQPALRPRRATPRVEDKPPQTRRPHSNGLCSPLSEGPDPGSAQRHVNAGSPVHTAPIKTN